MPFSRHKRREGDRERTHGCASAVADADVRCPQACACYEVVVWRRSSARTAFPVARVAGSTAADMPMPTGSCWGGEDEAGAMPGPVRAVECASRSVVGAPPGAGPRLRTRSFLGEVVSKARTASSPLSCSALALPCSGPEAASASLSMSDSRRPLDVSARATMTTLRRLPVAGAASKKNGARRRPRSGNGRVRRDRADRRRTGLSGWRSLFSQLPDEYDGRRQEAESGHSSSTAARSAQADPLRTRSSSRSRGTCARASRRRR